MILNDRIIDQIDGMLDLIEREAQRIAVQRGVCGKVRYNKLVGEITKAVNEAMQERVDATFPDLQQLSTHPTDDEIIAVMWECENGMNTVDVMRHVMVHYNGKVNPMKVAQVLTRFIAEKLNSV